MRNPYFQFSGGIFAALLFLVGLFFLFIFLPMSIVAEAFSKLGLTPAQGVLMFIAILIGRTVNLPVFTSERLVMVQRPASVRFSMDEMGRPMQIQEDSANELVKQVFAVNVGGCILPLLLSLTFLVSLHLDGRLMAFMAGSGSRWSWWQAAVTPSPRLIRLPASGCRCSCLH